MSKVLVVDDSGTMRKIITRALNAVGFTDVIEAADGAEGLRVFRENPVSLVLTDWNMPNKSGIELTGDIRASGSKVPIIIPFDSPLGSVCVEVGLVESPSARCLMQPHIAIDAPRPSGYKRPVSLLGRIGCRDNGMDDGGLHDVGHRGHNSIGMRSPLGRLRPGAD